MEKNIFKKISEKRIEKLGKKRYFGDGLSADWIDSVINLKWNSRSPGPGTIE